MVSADVADVRDDRDVVLHVRGISKTYPGTRALDDVSVQIRRGSVHALLGGNGSGKSTLIKVLAGVERADPGGEVEVAGRRVAADRTTPEFARHAGVHVVHQNPQVFPDLSVAENLAIGRAGGFGGGGLAPVRWPAVHARARAVLERFGVDASPGTLVSRLRPADRAMVAIARALQDCEGDDRGVLVLDEPTASLPATEADRLLSALSRYARTGQTILYVTHRLDEVVRIADTVTVLRDGRHVTTTAMAGMTERDLVALIVGRPLGQVFPPTTRTDLADVVLEARDLAGGPLRGVDLSVRRGEVLGIGGLLGAGRTELLRMLFGAMPYTGTVLLDGVPRPSRGIAGAMSAGIAYVPEERAVEAAFSEMSLRENLSAAHVRRYWKRFRLRHRAEAADAAASITTFRIRTGSDAQPLATLSGGNQQKAILARWLRREPRLLLLDEPTQGVDVAARAEIYALVRRAVARGAGVVVVTSDPEELARVADRVLVIAQGKVAGELRAPDIDPHQIIELSFGVDQAPAATRKATL